MAALRLSLSMLVLLMAVITLSEGMRGIGPKRCCFRFNETPVDKSRVVGYIRTSQRCPNPAILLKTVKGHQLCVKPSAPWVKNLISELDSKPVPGGMSNL